MVTMLIACVPLFSLCYLFAEILSDDFESMSVYIFTRAQSRTKRLTNKLIQLSLLIILYYGISYWVAATILLVDAPDSSAWLKGFELFWPLLLINALMALALLIPITIGAIIYRASASFITIFLLYLSNLFMCVSLDGRMFNFLYFALPSAQGVFAWHDSNIMQVAGISSTFTGSTVAGFSLQYSIAYLMVFVLIELICSFKLIQKIDLL
ncbi:MAG: hypothetical protein LBU07_04890 [Coriobacteriales bacterium]|nr:hypothetical protein [Coriobacteriales bacterium]